MVLGILFIVFTISLILIAIFHSAINNMKIFIPMKTISCIRYSKEPSMIQDTMIYSSMYLCLKHLILVYGKNKKYDIETDEYGLHLSVDSSDDCFHEVNTHNDHIKVDLNAKYIKKQFPKDYRYYAILLGISDDDYYIYNSTELSICGNKVYIDAKGNLQKEISNSEIMEYFIQNLKEVLLNIAFNHTDKSDYDVDFFGLVSALDYYTKGDFKNEKPSFYNNNGCEWL